ncbi:EF-hand domain-containing protein [Arhodomonas sp. AD133]|uniref:EF-hand domain-containing protein n=1 Tax=Arhodomonas sp. AD133 TaxID=3415009 RepID=UPI003EBCC765
MQRRTVFFSAVLLTATAVSVAVASPDGRRGPDLGYADSNNDGVVTVEEVRTLHKERFQSADSNGDGVLDATEMRKAMLRERAERRVQRLDTNGDGRVSAEEYAYPTERHLMMVDRNGNGRLEPAEMRPRHGSHWGGDDDHRHGHHDRRRDDD